MEEKLNSETNLNFIQSIAVRGEIASVLHQCKNEAEKEFASFILVNLAIPEHYGFYYDVIKEHIDSKVVDTYFLYKSSYRIPYHLWINKVISDMQGLKCHKDIKRSKFIPFMRTCLRVNDYAVGLLINELLEDESFDYLKDILLYFNEVLSDVENITWDTFQDRVQMSIDEAIKKGEDKKEDIVREKYEYNTALELFRVGINAFDILDPKEEIFGKKDEKSTQQNQPNTSVRSIFVVKKVLKQGKRVVSEKAFASEPEARQYREAIINDYPELTNQFEFLIEKRG